jgi:hypothetical protein
MAALASSDVTGFCLFATLRIVRIVAGRARQRSGAFLKTQRAKQAVRLVDNLELVVTPAVGGMVEMERVVGSRLSGPERKHTPIETAHGVGHGTGVSTGGSGQVRLNGVGRSGTKVTVDGTIADSNPEAPGTSMYQAFNQIDVMSIEAVQEVQTVKGIVPAEYAHVLTGNVNLITRSGGNSWHGSLFENNQVEELNARIQTAASRPPPDLQSIRRIARRPD